MTHRHTDPQDEVNRLRKEGRWPIHHDLQMLLCVYDARKAHGLTASPDPELGPGMESRQPRCANIARDDHHIELLRRKMEYLKQ